ncbi:hypothetical protein RJT34_27139 [Clitoria ternatea]|uniref:Uncharacterized protein n=1 Tax=Clitoria ternatea TaxID=43366 RepID=A0AAN9F7X6_CLITE
MWLSSFCNGALDGNSLIAGFKVLHAWFQYGWDMGWKDLECENANWTWTLAPMLFEEHEPLLNDKRNPKSPHHTQSFILCTPRPHLSSLSLSHSFPLHTITQ